ncbi:ABC transporter permease [Gordonia sp. NB41Y]|uniref:ABC transporter permease n=1 Tax=Gordonia sp. NB41Y TaxID=875808 RepID=UPI0002BFDE3B|nr:ABC transporter permease [Gordonia sp. NB41Y]EMP13057.1 ABC transporter permease [Gordonia sp. NB41Y]WLP92394.1 ABC transporter permease [Gordonia sp. NB41Y]
MTGAVIERSAPSARAEPGQHRKSTSGRRRGRLQRIGSGPWIRLVSPLVILALWQILSSRGVIPESKLAPPTQVWAAAQELWADGSLQDALAVSLQRVGIGLALGVTVAVLLGLLVGFFRVADLAIDPPLQMLRTVPFLGLIPLFVVWFGIGEEPKILMVALGVLFPLYLNLVSGIKGVDPKLIEAGRAVGLGRLGLARTVIIPGSMPEALTGFRLSLGVAWLSLIVAEQINADAGLGYLVMNARTYFRNDIIVLGLVIYALLGLISDTIVRGLESRLLRWRVVR